jgi:hypothetical protein
LPGKITSDFVPEIERMIREYFRIRVLVIMRDFHGWDAGALLEDLKWNAEHFRDIERLAVVGERTWHTWMTGICKPFSTTEVRYFERRRQDWRKALARGPSV